MTPLEIEMLRARTINDIQESIVPGYLHAMIKHYNKKDQDLVDLCLDRLLELGRIANA